MSPNRSRAFALCFQAAGFLITGAALKIWLDPHAWDSGILSMANFDIERETTEFFSIDECGSVNPVEPVYLDRGFGTVSNPHQVRAL